jgi:hypothetical protein
MVKVNTSLKKVAHTTKDSGGTTKWKERDKHILKKDVWNIRANGRPTSITDGEC